MNNPIDPTTPTASALQNADLPPSSPQRPEFNWAKLYPASASSSGAFTGDKVTIGGTGNVYTAGRLLGTADFDPGPGIYELTSFSKSLGDACIGKVKADGSFAWAKQFQGVSYTDAAGLSKNDSGAIITSIAVDTNGNTYTTGNLTGVVDFDPGEGVSTLDSRNGGRFFTKLDAGGNFVWTKQLAGSTGESAGRNLAVDAAGDIFLTGGYSGTIDLDPNEGVNNLTGGGTYAAKWSSDGSFQWAKQVDANILPTAGISVSNGGNTYVAGTGANGLSSITQLNQDGSIAWNRTYNFGLNNAVQGIDVDAAGNAYAIGYFVNTVDFDPSAAVFNLSVPQNGAPFNAEIFLTKLNADGSFGWAKQIPTRYDGAVNALRDGSLKIDVSDAGNVYVSGFSEAAFLNKYDTNGTLAWTKGLPGTLSDLGFDAAGNLIATGALNGRADLDLSEGGTFFTSGSSSSSTNTDGTTTSSSSTVTFQSRTIGGVRTQESISHNLVGGDVTLQTGQNAAKAVRYGAGFGAALAGQAVLVGADWKVATTGDFNKDGIADIVWQNASANLVSIWFMDANGNINNSDFLKQGGQPLSAGFAQGWTIGGAADINNDGALDLVVRNGQADASGAWLLNGINTNLVGANAFVNAAGGLFQTGSSNVSILGVGDFNSDGKADILHRNASGLISVWELNGFTVKSASSITDATGTALAGTAYDFNKVADFNANRGTYSFQIQDTAGQRTPDLLLRNAATGAVKMWDMSQVNRLNSENTVRYGSGFGTALAGQAVFVSADWKVATTGDFNNDGITDVVWQNDTANEVSIWFMNSNGVLNNSDYLRLGGQKVGAGFTGGWSIGGAADMNGDGKLDLVVRNRQADATGAWLMNGVDTNLFGGAAFTNADGTLFRTGSTNTTIAGIGDFNGDGKIDILHRFNGISTYQATIWELNGFTVKSALSIGTNALTAPGSIAPDSSYEITIGDFNGDNLDDIVWRSTTANKTLLWTKAAGANGANANFTQTVLTGLATPGLIGGRADFNGDGTDDLILSDPNLGNILLWNMQNGVVQPVGPASTDYVKTLENTFAKTGGSAWKVEAVGQFAR
jgi:FG-GAP-like repeat